MADELKIPAVGEYERNIGRLVKIDAITPPPPETYYEYIFEDISAKGELRLNGETLDTLCNINDFYGLGTSVTTAIEEMKAYAEKRKITSKSELEVVVIKVTEQTRMKPNHRENYSALGFTDFGELDYGSKRDLPEDKYEIVWSSKSLAHTLPVKE
jgi:hypothetical protein